MAWHVRFRRYGEEHLISRPTPEEAIEEACRLIDAKCDVFGIGTGPLTDAIGKDEIERIYIMWESARPRFVRRRTGPTPVQH